MVSMKCLFKPQHGFSCVGHLQLEAQLRTECRTIDQMKIRWPPPLGAFIAFGEHAHRNSAPNVRYRLKAPFFGAHKPMRRRCGIVRLASKPGEADGYSSPNCAAVLP